MYFWWASLVGSIAPVLMRLWALINGSRYYSSPSYPLYWMRQRKIWVDKMIKPLIALFLVMVKIMIVLCLIVWVMQFRRWRKILWEIEYDQKMVTIYENNCVYAQNNMKKSSAIQSSYETCVIVYYNIMTLEYLTTSGNYWIA